MKEQAEKAFQEMLDISTDIDKAVLFPATVRWSSPTSQRACRPPWSAKAEELAALGDQRATDMGSSALTQLVVESGRRFGLPGEGSR